jgi:hypothetical protein
VCNKILEEAGVLGDVGVEEFPMHFIPLEQDVLSLCLDDSFEDLYLVRLFISMRNVSLIKSSEKTQH